MILSVRGITIILKQVIMSIIHHRGDTKTSQENTLKAILSAGDMVEVDADCNTINLLLKHDDVNIIKIDGNEYFTKDIKYLNKVLKYENIKPVPRFEELMKILSFFPSVKLCLDLKLSEDASIEENVFENLIEMIEKYRKNIMYVSSFNDDLLLMMRKRLTCVDFGLFTAYKIHSASCMKKWTDDINPKYYIHSIDAVKYMKSPSNPPNKTVPDDDKRLKIKNVMYTIHYKDLTDYKKRCPYIDYYIVDTY